MNLSTLKQPKTILLLILTVALLGGVSYGGYRYWQHKQPAPEPQKPSVEEKKVEIVENEDGSKTYFSYIYNYKITVPEGWEIISYPFNERSINARRKGAPATEDLHILSFPAVPGESFIEYRRKSLINPDMLPLQPNYEFVGVDTYKYEFVSPHAPDVVILAFEHKYVWYEISIPIQFKDDPEYWSILNTFDFLKG